MPRRTDGLRADITWGLPEGKPQHPLEPLLHKKGACVGAGPTLFFYVHTGRGNDPEQTEFYRNAKAVCSGCPVQAECREVIDYLEGRKNKEYCYGVWAGETPPERWRRRKYQEWKVKRASVEG